MNTITLDELIRAKRQWRSFNDGFEMYITGGQLGRSAAQKRRVRRRQRERRN